MAAALDQTFRHIQYERDGAIACVTMNRPDRRNALSLDHLTELRDCFVALGEDRSASVAILRGRGPAFCAGHDLGEMVGRAPADFALLFQTCTELMLALRNLPQPVIAEVHGIATAAGCQLVASCDLAVAADNARFATPGVKIGLFCTTPAVALGRAVAPKRAMEMLLTGEAISAQDALAAGLINRVVPADQLAAATRALADKIAASSSFVIGLGKRAFYKQIELPEPMAYSYAEEVMAANAGAADAQEGMRAFLEKRTPKWSVHQ